MSLCSPKQNASLTKIVFLASAPVFASMLNLINEKRFAAGKAAIGFVNPVLYAHPEVMNDITNGTNAGCGTKGFSAVKGWDPITGLG